jgi:hypothetical protein
MMAIHFDSWSNQQRSHQNKVDPMLLNRLCTCESSKGATPAGDGLVKSRWATFCSIPSLGVDGWDIL